MGLNFGIESSSFNGEVKKRVRTRTFLREGKGNFCNWLKKLFRGREMSYRKSETPWMHHG